MQLTNTLVFVNKYLLLLPLLCITSVLKAQSDTVSQKISKIPYKHVDVIAKFPQGDFKNYITTNLQINHKVEYSFTGKIILLMGIGADGGIAHVDVLKSLSPQIDPEVVQVIRSSPKWQPARLNNQNISMDMVLDIDIAVKGANKPKAKPVVAYKAIVAPVKTRSIVISKPAAPVLIKKPAVAAINKTAPPIVKKPLPVIAKKVLPPAAPKKGEPPVVKKPIPVIAKKVAPPTTPKKVVLPVVKKPIPVIAKIAKKVAPPVPPKKIIPPVVKKPIPVIAKKVAPPVSPKKVEPPVVKKPIPVIAKKAVPPIVKKPLPVIAKKVIPPVTKKVELPVKKPGAVIPLVARQTDKPVVKKPKRTVMRQNLFKPQSNNAEFIGGLNAFFKYLSENIVYPPGSKKAGIQGRVNISFVIEEDGSVSDVEIISAPADDLGQEAIRVLLASPKWKPGMQNGKPVPVSFQIPINFTLLDKAN